MHKTPSRCCWRQTACEPPNGSKMFSVHRTGVKTDFFSGLVNDVDLSSDFPVQHDAGSLSVGDPQTAGA